MKKNGLQISFAWLFAIIVGAVILFLAIYFSTKIIQTEQTLQDAQTGKEIGILLNPLETGFESIKSTSMTIPVETRIYNKCNLNGHFGRQIIQISQKSFNKWTETDVDVGFSNKYIFSEEVPEARKFYVFSKPFVFPFKVADLIILTSSKKDYCFINSPEEIQEELEAINLENIFVENCSEESVKVCFEKTGCDVSVNYFEGDDEFSSYGDIEKEGDKIYFEGDALMYAGIFGENNLYECQVQRLMKRVVNSAILYNDKGNFVSQRGCNSNLNLIGLINEANGLEDSGDLVQMGGLVEDIRDRNNVAECKLW